MEKSYLDKIKDLSPEEQKAVFEILHQLDTQGYSEAYDKLLYEDFEEIPVDIHTFLHERRYLGNALYDQEGKFTLFPYWEKVLEDIFPTNTETKYNTLILTGAIGIGKSFVACVCLLYLLYRLLCLKDPYLYYGMQPIDKISISLMNITIENAKGVAMDKINQMLLASEWFLAHGKFSGTTNLTFVPDKHLELITASSNNQIIGRAILANFTDEVNFGLTSDVEKLKKKQRQLISQIDARMKSRFMRGTYLPTLNIIASSKNSDQSFLDSYIDDKRKNESKTTLIVDEPQWIVDSRKDTPEHFMVAIGNRFLANELLPLNPLAELVDEYRSKGYTILEVPMGYYENFQENIDGALTDIAGIATASSLKYISGVRWNEAKTNTYKNPFTEEIITVGNGRDDLTQYSEFFNLGLVPEELKYKPLYIHLDMSKTGDKTGICGVYITGKKPTVPGEDISRELFYKVAFSVSVAAPRGMEISFDKHRTFIRWLKEQGFRIKGISSDTYQSAQLQQQLLADGFDVKTISVDRLDSESKIQLQYAYFKSTLYDRRIEVYEKCDFLTEEVLGLERQSDGHINHPDSGKKGCFTGDTKISLVDGRELTLLELVDELQQGKRNFVYSFNETTKNIEPKLIEKAWCTKKNAELYEVALDNNEVLRCTPDHRFMLRDGSYCEAKDLKKNDSLMPLYRKFPTEVVSMKNYRMYYEPIEDAWHYEHRKFATEVLDEKYLVHHKNCNPKDNSPDNLVWCSRSKHQQIHKELSTGAHSAEATAKRRESIKQWHKNNKNTEVYAQRNKKLHDANLRQHNRSEEDFLEHQKFLEQKHKHGQDIAKQAQARKDAHNLYISNIEQMFNITWDDLTLSEKDSYSVKYARACNPTIQEKITKVVKQNHLEGKYENAYKALGKCNQESKRLKELCPIVDKQKFFEIFNIEYDSIDSSKRAPWVTKYRKIICKDILNHKVVSVRKLDYTEDVYDLTIADNHNFALAAGVFVHNSKDSIDAVVGALWNASQHAEEYAYEFGEDLNNVLDTNNDFDEIEYKQKFIAEFESELTNMLIRNYDIPKTESLNSGIDPDAYKSVQYIQQGVFV